MDQLPDRRADLSRSGVSRYIQLATLFRRRIDSGVWPAGQQIPTIDELADECGVARATIRQAVGLLEAEGLVARYRAKGTFVTERLPEPLWCEVETDWQGLLSSRDDAQIEILADYASVPLPALADLPGAPSATYRYLRRRHARSGKPYLVAEVYIDEKLARKIPPESFTTMTAFRLAASLPGVKVADARQTLTIGMADIETAELLDLPLNAPVCFVNRLAADQRGRLILVSRGIYRGDVVRMDLKLR
jgi:GntR family transcriptional regulator